ncbi:MAG TPA: DUF58 domain-containing protein [Chryseolinea sp.]|nr:DUF58 domain-containing protein [Chryseolinea sp.]
MKIFRDLFLGNRFFIGLSLLIGALIASYPFPFLLPYAKTGCILYALLLVIDTIVLFNRSVQIDARRKTPSVLSLGDENEIVLVFQNRSNLELDAEVIDELPVQLQIRTSSHRLHLSPGVVIDRRYSVRPLSRGEYLFGNIHVFVRSRMGLISRRITVGQPLNLPVYPSIVQMRKYEIRASARLATEYGVKKVRRVGHSYEFEHIKQYMRGDDYRSINWKATSRRAHIMVNQYEDEKSQQVYCIIDKSRVMHMPFNGLSLFDHAVNAALVISNIVLGKHDRAGLLTFAEAPKSMLKAERGKMQLKKILDLLYKEKEDAVEANYESMYLGLNRMVNGRGLLLLFTNFESMYALQRVIPQLKRLNNQHLLVVIFFENTEITSQVGAPANTLGEVYKEAIAEDYKLTKIQLVQELRQHGIMSILTRPEELIVTSINKYLELKSMGMI